MAHASHVYSNHDYEYLWVFCLEMKFLVIGDSCLDRFVYGKCERMCPEGPVPVFEPLGGTTNGGMAKNVQANVEALGIKCDIITNKNEIEKKRYVDKKTNQLLLRVDIEDETTDFFNYRTVEYSKYDAVIVSDYNKGFLSDFDISRICLEHNNVFFDTKRLLKCDLPRSLKFLKINEYELQQNPRLQLKIGTGPSTICRETNQIIVTHGAKGCWYAGKMYPPPKKVVAQDLSGAGDTFMAALAVAVTQGTSTEGSIKFANECACKVVAKRGVTTI